MATAQLKMWMCTLGIVFWIQNNSWQQKHERPHENSQCKKHWIMHLCSDKGPHKGTKQTSGRNCSPFKGATDHSAYGVGRFWNAWEISLGTTILVPETWEPDEKGLDWRMRWIVLPIFDLEYHFSALLPKSFTKLGSSRHLLFPKLQSLPQRTKICHSWRYFWKHATESAENPPEGGAKLLWVTLGLRALGIPLHQWGVWCLVLCLPWLWSFQKMVKIEL